MRTTGRAGRPADGDDDINSSIEWLRMATRPIAGNIIIGTEESNADWSDQVMYVLQIYYGIKSMELCRRYR